VDVSSQRQRRSEIEEALNRSMLTKILSINTPAAGFDILYPMQMTAENFLVYVRVGNNISH
jgi:hypothetical protein